MYKTNLPVPAHVYTTGLWEVPAEEKHMENEMSEYLGLPYASNVYLVKVKQQAFK